MKIINFLLIIPILVVLVCLTDTSSAKVVDEHIRIIPAGQIDNKIVGDLKNRLSGSFPMTTSLEVAARKELPQAAYNEERKQYDAQTIIDGIARQIGIDADNESVLILVDVDLYKANQDFVFGLSDKKKSINIISIARFGSEKNLLLARSAKEALYELGHSWSVEDCPSIRCVMHYSDNVQSIDKKGGIFCNKCRDVILLRYTKPLFKNAGLKPLI
jgi:archaemetzincin